ncbi:hypothetical protein CDV36_015060 [Fusarium kuroshium]|uniref:Heterokaryon incompatibility domain-containing protein n=1 Tax=Fusarium kuroshium TaxID=2010991 RepID=A0A3M2REP3_9HYPO|nr:hypothetical protein CDV36_015060 [Fusarium kuroshium]
MWDRDPKTGLVYEKGIMGYHEVIADADTLKAQENYIFFKNNVPQPFDKPFPMREIDLEASLLGRVRRPPMMETTGYSCLNLLQRPTLMWIKPIEVGFQTDKVTDPEWPFLNRLASICAEAEVYPCTNGECEKNRKRLEGIVQHCEWKGFREWLIRAVSCQMSFAEVERYGQTFFHLTSAVVACHRLVYEYKTKAVGFGGEFIGKEGRVDSIGDIFAVLDMIYWAIVVESHTMHMSTVLEIRWSPEFVPIKVLAAAVDKAASSASQLGICPSRLWNLALVTERREADLPALVGLAACRPQELRHEKHEDCLAGYCRLTSVDSTKVEQLHKCEGRTVPEIANRCSSVKLFFDPMRLNDSMARQGGTVWSIQPPFEILPSGKPYVAISHVWSDGTGIGLGKVGEVNSCLFKYFTTLIGSIDHGCEGIWWDTISIPTELEARRKAIDEMHNNYRDAQYTLVHDEYLVNFAWAEDGSPCIALVLSAWLTRGWTALEFIMSGNVKVIFKEAGEGSKPIVKDMDKDILARDPSSCSRAHWIASQVLRRLRKPITNVSELLSVLKPRTTSWQRDKMIIAALLAGVEGVSYKEKEADITRAILDKLYKIEFPSLLHGLDTVTETGAWSWCPPLLYDMPAVAASDLFGAGSEIHSDYHTCVIGRDGVIAGCYRFAPLTKEDVQKNRIYPTSSHPKIVMKVKAALQNWRSCMLMRDDPEDRGPCLLVKALGEIQDDELEGRPMAIKYVGCVLELAEGASGTPNRTYHIWSFKMGLADDMREVDASDMFERPSWMPERFKSMDWLPNKVWIGNHPNSGHLLVARPCDKGVGHTALYTWKMSDELSFGLNQEPLLVVSSEGEVSTKFNTASITLQRVNTKHAWPPTSIPCAGRAVIHSKEADDKWNRELSKDLFELAHETRTYIYAALETEVLLPSKGRPYQGLWVCSRPSLIRYHPHQRCEVILLNHTEGPQISGVNITGYKENPRGDISFKFSFSRPNHNTGPALVQAEIRAFDFYEPNLKIWKSMDVVSWTEDAFDLVKADGHKWGYPQLMVFKFRRIPLSSLLPDLYKEGL